MGLPPQYRLRGHRVFDRLYRQGRRLHGQLMVLRVLAAEPSLLPPPADRLPPSPWRLGVVVSGKVHKRAVRRNRLRRLLQAELLRQVEALRQAEERRPAPLGTSPQWLLLSLKPGCAEADPAQLLEEWQQLLRKAGLSP